MNIKKMILFLAFILLSGKAFVQVKDCPLYQIPSEYLGYQSIEDVSDEWASSGAQIFPLDIPPERQYDVTDYGILPDMQPYGEEINDLITMLEISDTNPAMLYFPNGAYLIDKPLILKGGVIIKGAGGDGELPGQTHFHFDLSADYAHPCITIKGEKNGVEDIYIIDDTKCYIEVISIPTAISASFPVLTYKVINAVAMETWIFDVCYGKGVINGNKGTFKCNGIEPGDYNVTTTFSNSYDTKTVNHTIKVYSKDNITIEESNIKEQENNHTPDNLPDSVKGSFPDKFYQHTINISGSNNWIRGVESFNTRRFHVYLSGDSNTISGCYFHHSINYSDDHGRGYGVCLSGTASHNRIEDNIFRYLRHSMVLQGDAEKNVIAYNYSREVNAYNGWFSYPADDLCLHGPMTNSTHGPKLNLLEGNYFIRSRIDDTHQYNGPNGPFNTYFRNRATDFFKIDKVPQNLQPSQYAQNIIGCNMKPKGNTIYRLDKYGFRDYYDDGNNYLSLPAKYCSFYLLTEPDFFLGWIQWPFLPNEENIIPAKYRWDTHDPQWGYDEVPYTIKQGWDDYSQLCGPPNYKFKNKNFENLTGEYLAMHKIILDNVEITQNTDLVFYAGQNVLLKSGTIILNSQNHVIIKAGNVCNWKSEKLSKYKVYPNGIGVISPVAKKTVEDEIETRDNSDIEIDNLINIFPNPSDGIFTIKSDLSIDKSDITILGIMGNELQFDFSKNNIGFRINLHNRYKGIILVKIKINNRNVISKLMIK